MVLGVFVCKGDESHEMVMVSTQELKRLYAKIQEYERMFSLLSCEEVRKLKVMMTNYQIN